MRRKWWSLGLSMLILAVVVAVFTVGCEAFKPKSLPDPDPSPSDDTVDYPDISGRWEIELRTNGTEYTFVNTDLTMTLVQDAEDVKGHWTIGDVDGEVEENGDVELILRVSVEPMYFILEGDVEDDGNEMSGEWKSILPPPRNEGTWIAERD